MNYSFDELGKSFWLYFISTQFPNASDETSDTGLDEFISENYELDYEWIDSFTQYYDGVIDENDGYVDNPNYISLVLNNHDFKIEFHAGDTLYFLDGIQIGCTGPHFILRTLSFSDFTELTESIGDARLILLVTPMLALEKQNVSYISKIIKSGLAMLNFDKEHIETMSEMIISGLL